MGDVMLEQPDHSPCNPENLRACLTGTYEMSVNLTATSVGEGERGQSARPLIKG